MPSIRLTDINIPPWNPAIAELYKSARMRVILEHLANTGVLIYQAKVAKRTGRLAHTARASVEIGGKHNNMLVGHVTVGGAGSAGSAVDYAAAHEYGTKREVEGPQRRKKDKGPLVTGGHHAARDLNFVLEHLGEFS